MEWTGWSAEEGEWKRARELKGARTRIDEFWLTWIPTGFQESDTIPDLTHRCLDCNKEFKRLQDLKGHLTRGCKHASASRAGTRAERAVLKAKQAEAQEAAGTVTMEGKRLKNVFVFKYLGFLFQADGDRTGALEQRMAIARSRFGELHEIWRSKKIANAAKVRIYACAVVSVLTYGSEIWAMGAKVKAKIRGWNARCLSLITGRGYRDETVEPSFDVLSRLRSRRLRWAGQILRAEESNLLRRVLLAQTEQELQRGKVAAGGLLMDVEFASMDELLKLAVDTKGWGRAVRALMPESEHGREKKAKGKGPLPYSDAWMMASGYFYEGGEWKAY